MRIVLVDGYNVVNSWPKLNEIKDISFDLARAELLGSMKNYSSFTGDRVYLVFDAHLKLGSLEKEEREVNVFIVFTKEGETADSYIERFVNDKGRKNNLCVVTSDLKEQQLIFQRGATRMSSLEFLQEVKKIEQEIKEIHKKKYNHNKNELAINLDDETREKLEEIRRSI
jgi:Predicted RNA-binding protein containing a PIN domain